MGGADAAAGSTAPRGTADGGDDDDAPRIEVLIPTFNEAAHVADAVRNALALGPVFVLDSRSTDGTQAQAAAVGAQVFERAFDDYATQKNWALDNLPFRGEWLFILDADERLTPALRDEVRAVTPGSAADGYFVNRMLLFGGRAVRHGGLYPSWNLRLFRRGRARYEQRSVHEHMVCDGPTGYLRSEMLHLRTETVTEYIAKHVRYADLESDEWIKLRHGTSRIAPTDRLFRHHLRYRQWLRRHVWPRMPGRPLLRFVHMYLIRLGFLDGLAGWHLARLMMSYEYMIGLLFRDKLLRARHGGGGFGVGKR